MEMRETERARIRQREGNERWNDNAYQQWKRDIDETF
jgi:hypothetical protein